MTVGYVNKRNDRRDGRTVRERYEKFVIKNENDCWGWNNYTKRGYGAFKFHQKALLAHRVAWKLYKGKIPNGKWVLHTCDNRICSNPDHLFLGNAKDNNQDRHTKNRTWRKLSAEKIQEIKIKLSQEYKSLKEIGKEYGVSASIIHRIKHNFIYYKKRNEKRKLERKLKKII